MRSLRSRIRASVGQWPVLGFPLLWLGTFSSLSASPTAVTNDALLLYELPRAMENSPYGNAIRETAFQERLRTEVLIFDELSSPSAQVGLARRQSRLGYASLDRLNRKGASIFKGAALDTLRTVAVETLPLEMWEDHWTSWLANSVIGTIGNPEEERMNLMSISYSAVTSLWEDENNTGPVLWGVRPWRTNPYIYFFARVGHFEGRPLATFEGRAGYEFFGTGKVEARVSLALPAGFTLATAFAFNPASRGMYFSDVNAASVTLQHLVGYHSFARNTLFYLGFRSGMARPTANRATGRGENLLVAGLARAW
ncbi:MAG TPA: hypothetical protein VLT36_03555 [Candidatus Dormibacteraeota bacterium]|nr:hypothetical protein [Candidatus Dormibacteraeota bacterium]